MPKQEIKVTFTQSGAQALTKNIHKLANATNKLNGHQRVATETNQKFEKVQQRVTKKNRDQQGSLENLLLPMAMIRNKMLLVAFAYNFAIKPFVRITQEAVKQAAKFESLRVRLGQLYGSMAEGKQAFDQFNAQAAKTPFMLDDIVNAGAQLKAFGSDARELLGEITDLAAFMGTNATEEANAFGRAFAG